MYEVGVAKADITPDAPNVGMMGWGDSRQTVQGVGMPIHARAVAIHEKASGRRFIYVSAEICFVTEALRDGVTKKLAQQHAELAIRPEELMLAATHTHCAPGGHSQYLLYILTIPGFQPKVFEAYRDGVVKAVVDAVRAARPASIRVSAGSFAPESKVAFNRALKSWQRDPDARPGEEIDREMTLLRFDGDDGRPIGCINWFAVHGTSMHRDYNYIHPDNKGVAAKMVEDELGAENGAFVSIFAQGAAGDVSPNFVKHRGIPDLRGPFPDDLKSCEFNARLQADQAEKLFKEAATARPLEGSIDCLLEIHNFSHVEVAPEFANGHHHAHTGPAAIGCGFLAGTDEGPGAPRWLIWLAFFLSRVTRYIRYAGIRLRGKHVRPPWKPDLIQGPKISFMESGRGRVLGVSRLTALLVPAWLHPSLRNLKVVSIHFADKRVPYTPQNLPLQLVRLGPVVFAAVPAEFTTVSGRRLKATVQKALGEASGVARVVICGYANAYSGYVTTFEEYQAQSYEGASTHFGQWTLAAYQTLFAAMAKRLAGGSRAAGPSGRS